jgi:hypothetical protein
VQALVTAIRRAAEDSSTGADCPPVSASRANTAVQAAIDIAAGR